jgi:GT2 family glycosyltransferase
MTAALPKIAVLILGYNDERHLPDALRSALDQSYADYQLIYIDNASTDGSRAFVAAAYPGVRVLANARNLGYAGAYREALDRVFSEGYEGAVLLNADVIVDRRWLEELVCSGYAAADIAFAQPKIFLWDGAGNHRANTFGNEIHYLGFGFCGHYKGLDGPAYDNDREITFASGASLLVKRGPYLEIGGLDESFFAYLEDQDLGWRARMRGYRSVLSARSVMWHKYSFTKSPRNGRKFYLLERNRLYFIYKNYCWKTVLLLLPAFLFMEAGVIADSVVKGYFRDKLRAYRDFARNLPQLRVERGATQALRSVPDCRLFPLFVSAIRFEEIDSPLLTLANAVLGAYRRIIARLV